MPRSLVSSASRNFSALLNFASVNSQIDHYGHLPPSQALSSSTNDAWANIDKMISALEGWQFDGVKGKMTIRAEDHALLQPMYQAKLSGSGTAFTASAQKTLTGDETAPPVAQMKG